MRAVVHRAEGPQQLIRHAEDHEQSTCFGRRQFSVAADERQNDCVVSLHVPAATSGVNRSSEDGWALHRARGV